MTAVRATRTIATRTVAAVAVVALGTIGLTGCGRENGSGTTKPSDTATPTASATASPAAPPSPTTSPSAWSSGPLVVTRNVPVPPVPQLLRVRSATHTPEGYDRIVFDFVGTLPGYDIRYVDTVIADGSGAPVSVPGLRYLRVIFRPAQAHDDSGTQAVTPRSETLNYPMLKAYAITGDFEGILTIHLGLDDVVGYHVGELPGTPGRIYLDVAA